MSRVRIRLGLVFAIAICTALVSGCVSVLQRNPVPEDKIDSTGFLVGREGAAAWGDETPHHVDSWFSMTEEQLRERHAGVIEKTHHYLAISGGGSDGAFGAGVLCGWTAAGNRPEFTVVTGISTGALIRTQGIGNMYELYLLTERAGLDYHWPTSHRSSSRTGPSSSTRST